MELIKSTYKGNIIRTLAGLLVIAIIGFIIVVSLNQKLIFQITKKPKYDNINLTCLPSNISMTCPESVVYLDCPAYNYTCSDCNCNDDISYVIKDYSYTSHLQRVISSVYLERNHAGIEKWDCDDMAEETADRINNAYGNILNCKVKLGYYYLENNLSLKDGHAWVECKTKLGKALIIESTNGKIIPPEEYEWYR